MYTFQNIWRSGVFGLLGESHGVHISVYFLGLFLCALLAYLLGSLNFGVIISKYKFHDDVRKHGSGNAGMTNMMRTYGKSAALFTLLGDALKAVVSVLLVGRMLGGLWGAYIAGLFCIIGHVYPVFFGFKGGKGVVTTAVMVLCLDPLVFLVLFILFVAIVAITKYISLGSVMCMLVYPLILYRMSLEPGINVVIAMLIAAFVIYLHRSNIQRLMNHTENKFSFKKKPAPTEGSDGADKADASAAETESKPSKNAKK